MMPQTRYSLYVILAAVLAATSNILTEIALRFFGVTPFLLAMLSNLIGGSFLVFIVLRDKQPAQYQHQWRTWQRTDWLHVVGAAFAIYVFAFVLRFQAIGLIGSGKSVLLGRLETIFVVGLAILVLGEHFSSKHWLAGLLAIGGTILINFNPAAWQLQFGWGEGLVIIASLGLATGVILLKPVLSRHDGRQVTATALLLGGGCLALFSPVFPVSASLGWLAWLLIALMGMFRGIAWSAYNVAMSHIGASRSAILFLTSAFFTVLFQVFLDWLAPQLGLQVPANLLMALIGGMVIMTGVVILQRP
jgi:drug/metabolite transporter (DMT)-like permease